MLIWRVIWRKILCKSFFLLFLMKVSVHKTLKRRVLINTEGKSRSHSKSNFFNFLSARGTFRIVEQLFLHWSGYASSYFLTLLNVPPRQLSVSQLMIFWRKNWISQGTFKLCAKISQTFLVTSKNVQWIKTKKKKTRRFTPFDVSVSFFVK